MKTISFTVYLPNFHISNVNNIFRINDNEQIQSKYSVLLYAMVKICFFFYKNQLSIICLTMA